MCWPCCPDKRCDSQLLKAQVWQKSAKDMIGLNMAISLKQFLIPYSY